MTELHSPEFARIRYHFPKPTQEEVIEFLEKVKPVIRVRGRLFYMHVNQNGLFDEAYTWEPKLAQETGDIYPMAVVQTLVTWSYYGLFKPTLAEVYQCFPVAYLKHTHAFELVGPDVARDLCNDDAMGKTEELQKQLKDAFDQSFHQCKLILYTLDESLKMDEKYIKPIRFVFEDQDGNIDEGM